MNPLPKEIEIFLQSMAKIPYENLSKVIKFNSEKNVAPLIQLDKDVIHGYNLNGTGGTCFSLTWYMCQFLKNLGYNIYPVMCDRLYGDNTHCCAILEFNNCKYLLDPAFLAFKPIVLKSKEKASVETPINTISLVRSADNRYDLTTIYRGDEKFRFKLKDEAVSQETFFEHWYNSFKMDSMSYPVVTLLKGNRHLYFQKENLYLRTRDGSEKIYVPRDKMGETLKRYFGISEQTTIVAGEIFDNS